jgi:hypothetical protein
MKIPILFTAALALLLAAAPVTRTHAQAPAQDASFDLFYNNLADDGDWYNTPEYGYVWQPYIAYKSDSWRPYSDGYWAQTDDGWTWVSYENFGWATYHYGRWTRLQDLGWAWVPGYEWGPGWVSWRTNDDYVGWAPLPPKRERGVYEGTIVGGPASESVDYSDVEDDQDGYTPAVDDQYDIGPENYSFVECRHFGAPVLSVVILPPAQNFVYVQNTVNVTNIYYQRRDNRTVVFNRGPDFDYLSRYSEQPIQRLRLERNDNPAYLRGSRQGGLSVVQNGVLQVASPLIARRPVNFAQVRPPRVKANLPQAQVIHGWTGVNANPQAVQQMRQKIKQQAQAAPARQADGQIVIPNRPTLANTPKGPKASAPAPAVIPEGPAPQPAGTQPKAPLTDAEKLARRQQREQERAARAAAGGQPAAPGQPAVAPPQQPAQETDAERAARKAARQQERAAQQGVPAVAPQQPTPDDAERAARKAARQQERAAQQGVPDVAPQQPTPDDAERAARKAARQQERASQPAAPAPQQATPDDAERAARRAARQQERASQPSAPAPQQPSQDDAERAARRAARQQERAAQPSAPAPQQPSQAEAERAARQAARQQERAAQPSAQPAQADDGKKKKQDN